MSDIITPLALPACPKAERTGRERLRVTSGSIGEVDNHAPPARGQSVEGKQKLVFPKLGELRGKDGVVLMEAVDSEEVTREVTPLEHFGSVSVLIISVGDP
jgi:hypothetical protein